MPLARIDSTKGLVIDNQSGSTGNIVPPTGTSSQLTAGDGTAVTVGSGLSLSGGTLTAGGYSTVWGVDWRTLTPASFSTSPTTVSAGGINASCYLTFPSGGTGTFSVGSNGLRVVKTGGTFVLGWVEINLSQLPSFYFNQGRYRVWNLWDNSTNGWISGSSTDQHIFGTTFSTTFAQYLGLVKEGTNTRSNVISTSNITAASTNAYDVNMVELDGNWVNGYLGISIAGDFPPFSSMIKFFSLPLQSWWILSGIANAVPTPGIQYSILQANSSITMGLLRSQIQKGI